MTETVGAYLLTLGSFGVVLCAAGWLTERLARRESSTSPTAGAHSRRDGPAASLLSMADAQAEREQTARDRAIEQVLREAGYPIDEEMSPRRSHR